MLNNGRVTKRYVLKNGTYYKTVHYKTVHVTKQYIFFILFCTINAPIQGFVGYLSYHNLTQDFVSQTLHNSCMARQKTEHVSTCTFFLLHCGCTNPWISSASVVSPTHHNSTMVRRKTVHVTKRFFYILYFECTNP